MGDEYERNINVQSLVETQVSPLYAQDFSDFHERDLGWDTGVGGIISMDEVNFLTGRRSLHLGTRRATQAVGDGAGIHISTPPPAALENRILITLRFDPGMAQEMEIRFDHEIGQTSSGRVFDMGLRIYLAAWQWTLAVKTGGAVWADQAPTFNLKHQVWHDIEYAIDPITHYFKWFRVDDVFWDISAYGYWRNNVGAFTNELGITTYTRTNNAHVDLWLDKVIIRGTEP